MKIILDKKRNRWAILCLVAGVLVIYLSAFYIYMFQASNQADSIMNYLNLDPVGIYFMVNSFLLTINGLFLLYKKINYYTVLSIILFFSVVIGWLVPNVAMSVISGLLLVAISGSPIIIPLFHIAVIGSFISAIKRWRGKTKYEGEIGILQDQQQIS